MNVALTRKLGLMQVQLDELGELDAFSELSDLDYLSKLESRLKRTITGLAEKGEVSENPLNTLEEHWKRATIFLRQVGKLSKAWSKAVSDPSKKKTWTKEALLEAKANLSRLQSQLDEDFRKLRELFHAEDWSGDGPPEPTLLAYESIVGEERNGLAKKFSKGLGLVIANLDKARTDYAAKGAQQEKALDSLLEDFEKEQIALSEAEGEWTKGKVDQVEKILSGLSGHFELSGAWRKDLDLRLASLDELQKLRTKARILVSDVLPSNWEAFLVELDGIRRRSSGLPGPIVDSMNLGDLKNTISAGLAKAREEEAKAERKRKRGRLFLCSFIIAAAGFAFYYFSMKEAEQARMRAEEAKIIAEAIDYGKLERRGQEGEELVYAPNQQTPYTGWVKVMLDNGQVSGILRQYKDGKEHGLWTGWHSNGQKPFGSAYADQKEKFRLRVGYDPRAAMGLRIVEIDEDTGDVKFMEVAQTAKGWFIARTGKADYPADADNLSTVLLDIRIHDVAGEGSGEHAKFGVLDPNSANPQDSGIGKYMALKNSSGSSLAELIIGNEVKGVSGLRYVRKPGENTVYMAELENVNNVSTKFVDWVEKDFLDLDKWDVKRVTLDNYDVNIAQGKINRTGPPHVLDYDSSEWKLSGKSLADTEELDKDKLDSLKDALDDLEIIDVESKPQILVENLKQGNEFFKGLNDPENRTVVTSLQSKGFYTIAVKDAAGQQVPKIVSNKGEILVGMKDAVEYVLRFGNATGDSRYIYAFARVNESFLDTPEVERIPKSSIPKRLPKAEIVRVIAEKAKAKARVKELNEKLAEWYYIISNDVYEKIRLERADFVKAKEKEEGDAAKPTEVAASHVLVAYKGAKGAARADPSITRSKEEAKTRADSLRKQIVDEAKDFATVARENSDGPSKTKGGDLGKFTFVTMAKAFSEAAFALDVGGVSEVVETPFGFHIIKRTE